MRFILLVGFYLLLFSSCQSNQDKNLIKDPSKKVKKQTKETKNVPRNVKTPVTGNSGHFVSSSEAKESIDYKNVNLDLMESLIHAEINKVRRANGLSQLGRNSILRNAAVDQNNYQLTVNNLTHDQNTPGKEKLIDRVKFYGGGFQLMAENLIYEGFTVRTINGVKTEIITPTYQEMAKSMVKNWLSSPPHRKNIMQSELKLVGTATAYKSSNHAIYATQVFGTKF